MVSSSPKLLARPALGVQPRLLAAPPPASDAFVRAQVAEAAAAAYADGRRDGERDARAELGAAVVRVEAAFAAVRAEIAALRAGRAEADVALAAAIGEAVLGREPHDGGKALLARLGQVLAELDDAPLVVRVHPGDAEVVAAAVAREGAVAVEVDTALAPGEARVDGRFASAALTRDAAWEAVRAVLDAGAGDDGAGERA